MSTNKPSIGSVILEITLDFSRNISTSLCFYMDSYTVCMQNVIMDWSFAWGK